MTESGPVSPAGALPSKPASRNKGEQKMPGGGGGVYERAKG